MMTLPTKFIPRRFIELRYFFGAEVCGFVEHETVAVAEDVGREPAAQAKAAGADDGSEARLNEGLAGLEVLAGDGHLGLLGEFPHCGDVDCSMASRPDVPSVFLQYGFLSGL